MNVKLKLFRFARKDTLGYVELDTRIREHDVENFDESIDVFINYAQSKANQYYVRELKIE